ncbi:hypothetical protein EHI8A_127660 [Entamoeba histolytica HM-1:IMSS-B]|uniref:Uncharacterized protein n=4 Tax=Entamoeba histolytica TaxID=5759 RepID=C4M348_ENTH1|nr:hypothetical protein EHI_059900 [Entamoeba histolytica HM-1:IMSS]EAL47507.1 hypothetical protein EHI_059900 [Entamoeba histolytica HM-1:IMSS]EMH76810.1 hypothetical protein EHI8A_127660 [Entamoeba histolytica HM-1:IMSS-B]ENY62239.1 hypothetical protein EHI7A_116720 [Entamoeba histolytica HM-1:IMSS-A]GAT95729.1 hypothetical protein CL6EHI_059900 [Entamoeba histolytica]|eukprot:XP_652893.1 hypothetical protein EHI_059900 [Entamoeba histolytica HM-1:IMSS]
MKTKILVTLSIFLVVVYLYLLLYHPNEIPFKYETKHIQPPQPKYKNKFFDLSKFNYKESCGNVFQYQPSNAQDLILYCGSVELGAWKEIKKYSDIIQPMINEVMPNVTKVFLLIGKPPTITFLEEMKRYGVKVIQRANSSQEVSKNVAVVQRIFVSLEYLKENKNKYNRVIFSDFRDVFYFSDAFATFTKDDLILLMECYGINSRKCTTFTEPTNFRWVQQGFGRETASLFAKRKEIIINGGLFFGGIDKVIELLTIEVKNIKGKRLNWGLDQAALNYVYYTGQLNHLSVTKEFCSQRICFTEAVTSVYNHSAKTLVSILNGCSPVIRHKIHLGNIPFP